MTDNTPGLSDEELEQQDGEQLPDREQMSLINANLAAPINAAASAPPGPGDPPQLADGVHLLGEYAGSGYVEPQYLAARGSSQIQLSKLLHLVADECDGTTSYDDIARRVSESYGKTVSADNV